jgi:PAS domain S-box-containing protein
MIEERTAKLKRINEQLQREITERKKAEEKLRASEGRYRLLADNVKDVIWTMNLKLQFTYASPSCEKLFGYTPDELLTFGARKILKPTSFLKATKTLAEELMIELMPRKDLTRSRTLELGHVRKDGSSIWCELVVTFLRDEKGKAVGILGITRDITERKRAEEELKNAYDKLRQTQLQLIQSAKMASVGFLASGVAHEINNPLFVISGEAEMLLKSESKDIKEAAETIVEQTIRIKKITEGLLEVSPQKELKLEPTDINEIIEKSISTLSFQVKWETTEIVKELEPNLPLVSADANQLKQVFLNIMLNAIQAMEGKGRLTITTRTEEVTKYAKRKTDIFNLGQRIVVIEFKDTGCGMDEETRERVFDPFFSTKEKQAGMGLFISYGIIENHKGTIEAQGKLQEGSTFIIKLPILKKEEDNGTEAVR